MRKFLTTTGPASLLIGWVFPSVAQAQQALPDDSARRWYVGIQAAAQRYQVFYGFNENQVALIPWQITGGYRLSPRLGVQLGLAYRNESGPPAISRYLSLPVTVRYTISRRPERRLRVDGVGGLTTLFARNDYLYTDPYIPNAVQQLQKRTVTQPYVTFGLAPHYRFSSRIEATADLLLNRSTNQRATTNLSFLSAGLGLRVRL